MDDLMLRYLRAYISQNINKYKSNHEREQWEDDEQCLNNFIDWLKESLQINVVNKERAAALLTAAIMWQGLEKHYFGGEVVSPLGDIITVIGEGHMGLMGPDNGFITHILESCCGKTVTFRLHSLSHDVAGRFRKIHNLGPGYLYDISHGEAEWRFVTWLRILPVAGHLSGLIYAFSRRRDIMSDKCFKLIDIKKSGEVESSRSSSLVVVTAIGIVLVFPLSYLAYKAGLSAWNSFV